MNISLGVGCFVYKTAMCGKFAVHAWRYSRDLNKNIAYRFIEGQPMSRGAKMCLALNEPSKSCSSFKFKHYL